MFHYDNGLKLTAADLAVDVRRRQPRAFISHAHADHMARHELALCTPDTEVLYHHRLGRRRTLRMPYRETIEFGPLRLTAFPAGHCLGSAMLLAEDGEASLLYTGDFKLAASATAEPAELPRADILVMECTFGKPWYRLPPRDRVIEELIGRVRAALARGRTPVVHAYVLGKAQEVTRILTDAGIPVLQHPDVHAISRLYEARGVALGDYQMYAGEYRAGHAVVVPPQSYRSFRLRNLNHVESFAVTGWALARGTGRRLGVDHALPLSDHADFDELLEAARRVNPRVIYCTHGPDEFARHLRQAGFEAELLRR